MTLPSMSNKLTAKYRLWKWQRNYHKLGQYKHPRKLYVVVKVVGSREYGYWRGCHKYDGYTFTPHPAKAYLFKCKDQAEATADNSMLYRHANYKVIRYKK
jgi:hypothetical protein